MVLDGTIQKNGKAYHAERAIRFIKTKIYRKIRDTDNKRYIDILPHIVRNYNNTIRPNLGIKPVNVNRMNEFAIFQRLYGKHLPRPESIRPKYKVGNLCTTTF